MLNLSHWNSLIEILTGFSQTHFELNLVESGRRFNRSAEEQVKKPASVAKLNGSSVLFFTKMLFQTYKDHTNTSSVYWPLARK